MSRLRLILGVGSLLTAAAAACAFSLVQSFSLGPDYRHADVLAEYHLRMGEIRPRLSAFSRIEYIEDRPPAGERFGHCGYVTQYVLCPAVVVIDGGPQARVLVDGREAEPAIAARRGLILEWDACNGVRLYRAEGP
jgi:hypothetical protein